MRIGKLLNQVKLVHARVALSENLASIGSSGREGCSKSPWALHVALTYSTYTRIYAPYPLSYTTCMQAYVGHVQIVGEPNRSH
jgi:hypothetical protein